MRTANLPKPGKNPAYLLPGEPTGRFTQIRAYQQLARVRLQEKLIGSPTGAVLYDLLMRDQLAFIKLSAPARHA